MVNHAYVLVRFVLSNKRNSPIVIQMWQSLLEFVSYKHYIVSKKPVLLRSYVNDQSMYESDINSNGTLTYAMIDKIDLEMEL